MSPADQRVRARGDEGVGTLTRELGDLAPLPLLSSLRLLLAVQAGRPIHMDFLHPNALGNRAAAHALLEGLCAAELLPEGTVRCT